MNHFECRSLRTPLKRTARKVSNWPSVSFSVLTEKKEERKRPNSVGYRSRQVSMVVLFSFVSVPSPQRTNPTDGRSRSHQRMRPGSLLSTKRTKCQAINYSLHPLFSFSFVCSDRPFFSPFVGYILRPVGGVVVPPTTHKKEREKEAHNRRRGPLCGGTEMLVV